MEAYYRQRLTPPQQAAYHAMKTGFTALAPRFPVPLLDRETLSDLFFLLRLDCPEIFYVTGFSYRYAPGAENAELLPEYLFDKGKIRQHQQALTARVEKLSGHCASSPLWSRSVPFTISSAKTSATTS